MPELPSNEILESIEVSSIFLSVVIAIVVVVIAKLISASKVKLLHRFPQYRYQIEQSTTIARFLVLLCGFSMAVLAIFGFSKEVMLAIGGSMAVAVGFGLKDVASSVLSGFFILFERPFQVGDRVSFGGSYGDVISIGLRSTQLRTLDDNQVTIPNNQFISDSVSSANAGALDMMTQVDFYVSIDADLDQIEHWVRECVVSSRYVYLRKPIVILFTEVMHHEMLCMRIRVKAYVIETKYEKPFESDLTLRIRELFVAHSVPRPILITGSGHKYVSN
ncbi:MAG: mechanosensitive ion channel [Bdellovibrionales bacterium]|nr:mechanosensitive ion channel [Bdellovibrionales bacterium]